LEYGGLNPDVTRVLYTQGSLDPWHALGRETDLSVDSPVIMIDGKLATSQKYDLIVTIFSVQDNLIAEILALSNLMIQVNFPLPELKWRLSSVDGFSLPRRLNKD
jgi:hypothetical protein